MWKSAVFYVTVPVSYLGANGFKMMFSWCCRGTFAYFSDEGKISSWVSHRKYVVSYFIEAASVDLPAGVGGRQGWHHYSHI